MHAHTHAHKRQMRWPRREFHTRSASPPPHASSLSKFHDALATVSELLPPSSGLATTAAAAGEMLISTISSDSLHARSGAARSRPPLRLQTSTLSASFASPPCECVCVCQRYALCSCTRDRMDAGERRHSHALHLARQSLISMRTPGMRSACAHVSMAWMCAGVEASPAPCSSPPGGGLSTPSVCSIYARARAPRSAINASDAARPAASAGCTPVILMMLSPSSGIAPS